MDLIYVVQNERTRTAYVGRTHRTLAQRWSEHLHDAANALYEKKLAEALRHDPDGFEMLELEHSTTASEAEWYQAFVADGWNMLNEAAPQHTKPKQRDKAAEAHWRDCKVGDGDAAAIERFWSGIKAKTEALSHGWLAAHPEYAADLKRKSTPIVETV